MAEARETYMRPARGGLCAWFAPPYCAGGSGTANFGTRWCLVGIPLQDVVVEARLTTCSAFSSAAICSFVLDVDDVMPLI